jgi:hypothetical protein
MMLLINSFSSLALLTWKRAKPGWTASSVQEMEKELLLPIHNLTLNLEKPSLTARQVPPLLALASPPEPIVLVPCIRIA